MKRTIFTALCALMTLATFAQTEKVMRVHKTDGSVVEYHVGALRDISFTGKAIINDDDYTQISKLDLAIQNNAINIDMTAKFSFDDPFITGQIYREDWGILYSTSPDVTVENGTLLELKSPFTDVDNLSSHSVSFRVGESVDPYDYSDRNKEGVYVDLDYNTTYYFRSYVYRPAIDDLYEEQYFYSAVKSVDTGKPSMSFYGVEDIPANAAEVGYILPTEEAWIAFEELHPEFSLSNWNNKEAITKKWNEYLTPERINNLKLQCSEVYECLEGTLYVLYNVGEDFFNYLVEYYSKEYTISGYTENLDVATNTTGTYIECDASWNVPGNGYWKYTADEKKNPSIEIPLTKCMLASYYYKIEITLAPNTEPEETLPAKVTSRIQYDAGGSKNITSKYETNPNECSIITIDSLEVSTFTEASLLISSDMNTSTSSRNPDRNKFLPILRVAQIKVTPYKKENTESIE